MKPKVSNAKGSQNLREAIYISEDSEFKLTMLILQYIPVFSNFLGGFVPLRLPCRLGWVGFGYGISAGLGNGVCKKADEAMG